MSDRATPATGRPTRERVADYVVANPGLHFNELVRRLDLAPGQAQYHLRRLARADRVVGEQVSGRTHYFDPALDPLERRRIALFRRETARDAVVELLDAPASPDAVAEAVGVARSTLEHHLDGLVDAGVVEKRRDSRGRVTLALTDPEATARSLRRIEPSLPDRLLDRFTRLVDALLE
ncbi:winged helix-turn-helix transcriptional regulator [Halobaculum magnesiiphilum]|uniref:Helix-turn-helix domain-containing protein n=1 Tax=Halobaculum magnesiiphilum TaxID=1017351 RepID=A0A8T8WDH2_9EURY|nr:helix-turn-helix domain-containing protein [Halobaculum magnesiiphilum]QZP37813.1 helix-turn-helix domain-containing protein [Halobaculum magnesiiphilum]